MISTNQFKNGNHIEVEGTVFKILEFQHVKPGKGGAFVRTRLRRASDGAVIDRTFRAGEKFRPVRTEVRRMQFLYGDGTDAHFMDSGSYEQLAVPDLPSPIHHRATPGTLPRLSGCTISPDGVPLTAGGYGRIRQWRDGWRSGAEGMVPALSLPDGMLTGPAAPRAPHDGLRPTAGREPVRAPPARRPGAWRATLVALAAMIALVVVGVGVWRLSGLVCHLRG